MVGRPLLLHRLTAVMLDADEKPLFVRGFLSIFPSTTAQMLGGAAGMSATYYFAYM